jgi:ATP-dependent helicase YprA (DUF1998 family)
MRENPPQILLTNYMMLELLLTRLRERSIRDGIYQNLSFLVFDELHTYRGRQGADVAMLMRRIRALHQAGGVYWHLGDHGFGGFACRTARRGRQSCDHAIWQAVRA